MVATLAEEKEFMARMRVLMLSQGFTEEELDELENHEDHKHFDAPEEIQTN